VYIKPSGANIDCINENDISVVDMNCNQFSGLKFSVDTPIHVELYRAMPHVKSICHTHSTYATSFAQANRNIQMYGTTHADMFVDDVRVIEAPLSIYETGERHEKELGIYIAKNLTPSDSAAILVTSHGPFTWSDKNNAVDIAIALEEVAKMAFITEALGGRLRVSKAISSFHWDRKHGKDKRYGQDGN
jgi:L-ribulose-5-phosphate 4-epimerase